MYLYIFEISAPRGFGDKWALGRLKELVPDFQRPNKKSDPKYSGEYDFWLDWIYNKAEPRGTREEIKTSRAVDSERPDDPLCVKALSSDSSRLFEMNFPQIKTKCADVFLWIAVWRDEIRYWVLNSKEVQKNKYFSKGQHRGNIGEGQLHMNRENISDFDRYEVKSTRIKEVVIAAYKNLERIK